MRRALLLAACAATLQATPASVWAAGDEGWAYNLAAELLSPYCPGRTLADCPSQDAQTLRVWLITQAAAGRSRADVEAELVDRFGEEILAAPPTRGFGLTAYVVPVAAFGLGGLLVAVFLRRQTLRAPARDAGSAAPLDPEMERVVEEDLGR